MFLQLKAIKINGKQFVADIDSSMIHGTLAHISGNKLSINEAARKKCLVHSPWRTEVLRN